MARRSRDGLIGPVNYRRELSGAATFRLRRLRRAKAVPTHLRIGRREPRAYAEAARAERADGERIARPRP